MSEKVFADGFSFKRREKAPEFVIGSLSVKVEEAIAFLKEHASESGWVNLNINMGKTGKHYVELDTWKPSESAKPAAKPSTKKQAAAESEEDLPF
jgi:hypothetical protein